MNIWPNDHSHKIGAPPGSLSVVSKDALSCTDLNLITYGPESSSESVINKDTLPQLPSNNVNWINLDGLGNIEVLTAIGKHFNIHDLTLEDILNTNQRPKVEFFDNYVFITLKMLYLEEDSVETEHISFILKDNFVLTFQEKPGDVFQPIRQRIQNKQGRIRTKAADYLLFALMDCLIDNYFILLDQLGDKIEQTEEEAIFSPSEETRETIHILKRETIFLKKSIRPIYELVRELIDEESDFFLESTYKYLRDLLDHIGQINENIDSYRELTTHLLEIYLSGMSHKMNQVMKVLTIVSTIFIPLTFIVGVYGMNFKYMPELEWKWSYPITWSIMVSLGATLVYFFKRKKWF